MNTLLKVCGTAFVIAAPLGAANAAEVLFGLTSNNQIVSFNSANPSTVSSTGAITGLLSGAVLTGIDRRPADKQIYTVSTIGTVYRLAQTAGGNYAATVVGDLNTGPTGTPANDEVNISGARFGIDFNPVPDRLRFITDFDQNLRINPGNAVTIRDGVISAPGAEALVGAAYTNSFAGALTTTLYAIDASGNQLLRSSNPNAGTYDEIGTITLGGAMLDFGGFNNVGFDISGGTGTAFFNIGSALYSLNLTNAQATSLGTVGAGSLIGLTAGAVPEPATWLSMIFGFAFAGVAMRRRAAHRLQAA